MSGKVLVIVGMGPQLGMAIAQRFGLEGFRLALIARNRERLDGYVSQLEAVGIEAAAFVADVCDRPTLEAALAAAKSHFGRIDALEYSPMIDGDDLRAALKVTPESVQVMMDHIVYGAIAAANIVTADMIAQGSGILLFTVGVSAVTPLPSHTNAGIAMAGLHRYVESLNISLTDCGVYAGEFVIGEWRTPGDYADILWNMAEKRDQPYVVLGDPAPLAAYETLVARGYGQPHPARLSKPLPSPRDSADRETLLLALYHASLNAVRFADAEEVLANIHAEVERLGGNIDAPRFGWRGQTT